MKKIRNIVWLVIIGMIAVLAIVGIYMPFKYQAEAEASMAIEKSTAKPKSIAAPANFKIIHDKGGTTKFMPSITNPPKVVTEAEVRAMQRR